MKKIKQLKNNHYNKNLKPFAGELRKNLTKAEIHLWVEVLRNKQLLGYPFLRQRPIGNYIADFFCKELKLIIELDGGSHIMQEATDEHRDTELKQLGYTTLRFSNNEVIFNTHEVRMILENWIKTEKQK
jgi:very-short-patch-repair endonuclease